MRYTTAAIVGFLMLTYFIIGVWALELLVQGL